MSNEKIRGTKSACNSENKAIGSAQKSFPLRDDDPFDYPSLNRISDKQFFEENPTKKFRLVSAAEIDLPEGFVERGGYDELTAVRIAKRPNDSRGPAAEIVVLIQSQGVPLFNLASCGALELGWHILLARGFERKKNEDCWSNSPLNPWGRRLKWFRDGPEDAAKIPRRRRGPLCDDGPAPITDREFMVENPDRKFRIHTPEHARGVQLHKHPSLAPGAMIAVRMAKLPENIGDQPADEIYFEIPHEEVPRLNSLCDVRYETIWEFWISRGSAIGQNWQNWNGGVDEEDFK